MYPRVKIVHSSMKQNILELGTSTALIEKGGECGVDGVAKRGINVMHFNIQGLNGKLLGLERILMDNKVDILCLTEHWELNEMTGFCFGDYHVSSCFYRKHTTRGGVCIISRKDLEVKTLPVLKFCSEKEFEVCCSSVTFDKKEMVVCAVYRSPSADFRVFMDLLEETLGTLRTGDLHALVVAGDFNVELRPEHQDRDGERLKNFLREYDVVQTIFEPTRIARQGESCIDNIFTGSGCRAVRVVDGPLSDHTYQLAELNITNSQVLVRTLTRRLYTRQKITGFIDDLGGGRLGIRPGRRLTKFRPAI